MFTILRIYTHFVSSTELTDNISQALAACAIYLEDPNCEGVKIWNTHSGDIILEYWRDFNE